jgi:hypothetical protein
MVFVLIQRVFPILERKHARVGSRGTQRSQRVLKAKSNIKVSHRLDHARCYERSNIVSFGGF